MAKLRKYKKVSCHTSVTAARRAAKSLHKKGLTASVRKTKNGACVWSAGKRRKVTLKTGQTLFGVKRKKTRRRRTL